MIEAVLFDLDGTLVQTERLKALSYTRAAMALRASDLDEEAVMTAFKEVVGLSRHEVAATLLQRFNLEAQARARMAEFGVQQPWQAFVQVRLGIYEQSLSDPNMLKAHACPYNIGLLHTARRQGLRTGLATMSYRPQVNRVLDILGLKDEFDFIASRDDVENAKPDPEIYHLVARQLKVAPAQALVIEDSTSGVKAALSAGMPCIVVTNDFTRKAIHAGGLLDERWIVDDPALLESVAQKRMRLYV